jgi:hypothetical protein
MPKQTAQDIIDQLAYRDVGFSDEDPDFGEVEQRLQTAQYYKLLLKQDLFDDGSESGDQVQEEVREFIRARIKVLLGIEAARVNVIERDPVFSADEITALKELAHRLLAASEGLVAKEPAKAPASPVETPKAETKPQAAPTDKKRPGPKPGTKYGPRKPSLRKVEVPAELREETEAPVRAVQARPAAAAKAKPGTPVPGELGSEEAVELESNPRTGARRIRKNGKVLEQAIDPIDGAILENEHGGEIWLDVTPPARPASGFVPMPTASSQPGAPMEQLGMQEVMNTQQRLSDPKNPLSDTISQLLR